MKICIDIRLINSSGIGTYIQNIIPFLIKDYKLILIGHAGQIDKFNWKNDIRYIEMKGGIYSALEQFELPFKIPACDFFWSPHYNIPLLPLKAKKRIVTIHDVFHLAFWDTLSITQKLYAYSFIKYAVSQSDVIFTVSEFSKSEIIRYTNVAQEKILITPNAIDFDLFKVINDIHRKNALKIKYELPDTFILFVGNVKPHKNLKGAIKALGLIKQKGEQKDLKLVIVGKREGFLTGDEGILDEIKLANLENDIIFTGYVETEDLPFIYNQALFFIFPSLYEGFGIPPLEAMACGCPTLVSNAASLPEVCKDASMYIDPLNISDISNSILLLMNDRSKRISLIEKGLERVKYFNWNKTANIILQKLG